MIKVTNLNKYYNRRKSNELHVINNTSLELPETGLVCILGESGSGKTTLMNTISGLDNFSDGIIEVDGKKITKFGSKIQEQVRNEKFGYIFQNYYLLMDRTVEYNLQLGLSLYNLSDQEKEERIDYVLKAVDMWRYKKRQVAHLSGGQQQRVAIARALSKAPEVIFADEPTGNLDEANTLHIMGILKKISRKCLVIVVTHENAIADFFADRIIRISDGKIEEDIRKEGQGIYEYVDDGNLYLKEYPERILKKDQVELAVYERGDEQKIKLQLVYEQGKLYLSGGDNRNIEFLTNESEKKVIDSTRPIAQKKDVENIAFELESLDGTKKAKMKFSEIMENAAGNLKNLGKKRIFPSVALFVIAVLITLSVQQILSGFYVDKQEAATADSHYYKISAATNKILSSDDYRKYFGIATEELQKAGYKPEVIPATKLFYKYEGFAQLENTSYALENYSFVSLDRLSEKDLVYGEMPKEETEIVLDEWLVENFRNSSMELASIITDVSQVIGSKINTDQGIELTVTGVSRTNQPDIYADSNLMLMLTREYYTFKTEEAVQKEYPDYQPKNLSVTENGMVEVLVSQNTLKERYSNDLGDKYGQLAHLKSMIRDRQGRIEEAKGYGASDEDLKWFYQDLEDMEDALEEEEERLGMTFDRYSELMNSDTEWCSYSYSDVLTGNTLYTVKGYYTEDLGVDFVVSEEAVAYFEKALLDNNKRCYIYTDFTDAQEGKKKIESIFSDEVKENLSITVENEAEDAFFKVREANKAELEQRILLILAIFLISLIILYFIMKSKTIARIQDMGVYRMLGISKGNIYAMFAWENILLSSETSLIAVLITVLVIKQISGIKSLGLTLIFPWYAVAGTILLLYVLNILIGLLPVRRLLKLPPAQLAAKYDI